MTPSEKLAQSYKVYSQTYEQRPGAFSGMSLVKHIPDLTNIISGSNICNALDYGCAEAGAWKRFNLKELWGLEHVSYYDPGVERFKKIPEGRYDLVICTDVMEHVPEDCVDEVLSHIESYAKKLVFFSIATRPASKTLADGTNAHATVQRPKWWLEKINRMNVLTIAKFQ